MSTVPAISVRSRPDIVRAAAIVAVILAVIVPVLWMGARIYADTRRASSVLAGEQIAIDRLTHWQRLLFELQRLRASSARAGITGLEFVDHMRVIGAEAHALEPAGIDDAAEIAACGSTWRGWQRALNDWSRSPQPVAFANVVKTADCFAIDTASSSGLVVDPDPAVQILTSIVGYNAAGVLRRIGDAATAFDTSLRDGMERKAVIATSRTIGLVTRSQTNIDEDLDQDFARNDPTAARVLEEYEQPLSAAVARFTQTSDAALAAPGVSRSMVDALDRLAERAVVASQPFWTRAIVEMRRHVAREQAELTKRRYELLAFVAVGIAVALGVVTLAANVLARRHRRDVTRLAHERDVLAARFAAERALSITEAQLHAVFESSLAAIAIFDRDLRIVQANAEFRTLALAHDQLENLAAQLGASTFATLDRMTVVERRVETSGGPVWLSFSMAAVFNEERCMYAIAMIRDVTAAKAHEQRLVDESRRDPLTQLANRAGFEEKLAVAIAQAQPFAVAFIDLDRFKPINDRFGHAAGDEVLIVVAARLRGAICASDTAARLGGDEYALILGDVADLEQAESIARRVRSAIEAPIGIGTITVDVSASIGITLAHEATVVSGTDLIARADRAMYRAKTQRLGYAFADMALTTNG